MPELFTVTKDSRKNVFWTNVVVRNFAPGKFAENFVVLHVKGKNLYLMMNLYSDKFSRGISSILAHM